MGFKKPISIRHNYKKKHKKLIKTMNEKQELPEIKELHEKIHEILKLLNGAMDLKNTAKLEILGDEVKKSLINQAWQLINKIHEISKKTN